MYGMVNEGIRSFIIEKFGKEKWREITLSAALVDDDFILMETYPDKITFDLVNAICKVLGITQEQALEEYGKYWIDFASGVGYETLLEMFGNDFRTSLMNLNHMHEHMGSFMTGIVPPAFHLVEDGKTYIVFDYVSQRKGLAPLVRGILYGLLTRYNQKGRIEILCPIDDGYRFKITFL